MASDPTFGTAPYAQCSTFTNGMGTRPRAIWTPGSNGSRVHFISQANSVSSNPTLYMAEEMTLQSNMGTGAHVDNGGSPDTLTRSSGSFITDGWMVGDRMWVSGSTTLANDYLVQITGVASGTLTFATATVNAAENLPAGAKIYRMHQLATVSGPSNAGNSTSAMAANLLDLAMMPALFPGADVALFVRPDQRTSRNYVLAASLSAAPSTSQFVEIICMGADY